MLFVALAEVTSWKRELCLCNSKLLVKSKGIWGFAGNAELGSSRSFPVSMKGFFFCLCVCDE